MITISILLGAYVLVEGFLACCLLEPGLTHFCTKAKYVTSASAAPALAGVLVYYSLPNFVQWVMFLALVALALCVWPRMVYRYHSIMDAIKFYWRLP